MPALAGAPSCILGAHDGAQECWFAFVAQLEPPQTASFHFPFMFPAGDQ
jgi:hypothetical protein